MARQANEWTGVALPPVLLIAAKAGQVGQGEILVITHLDTYLPRTDRDLNHNLGGLTLQGVDDNAAGILLALARELGRLPLRSGVRFVVLSAVTPDLAGRPGLP